MSQPLLSPFQTSQCKGSAQVLQHSTSVYMANVLTCQGAASTHIHLLECSRPDVRLESSLHQMPSLACSIVTACTTSSSCNLDTRLPLADLLDALIVDTGVLKMRPCAVDNNISSSSAPDCTPTWKVHHRHQCRQNVCRTTDLPLQLSLGHKSL